LIISWGIWLARNKGIFKEVSSSPSLIAAKCASIYSLLPSSDHTQTIRNIITEQIRHDIPWAYFDGASDAQNRCGSGLVIHINDNRSLKASVGIGSGTNNFAELLSLKYLLCWLIHLGIGSVQIFGDSMNAINWFNNTQRCRSHVLIPILEEIQLLKLSFVLINVCHIYRERNTTADLLSKEGLQQDLDSWRITETEDGAVRVSDNRPYNL